MIRKGLVASATFALALSLPLVNEAYAQSTDGMTAEQMTKAFEKQKTRGLVLVPADTASTDTGTTTTVAATRTCHLST